MAVINRQARSGAGGGNLPRAVLLLLGLAGAVVVFAGLQAFSGTLGPAFLALVLVLTVQPLSSWLQSKGVPVWVGVVVVLLIVYAALLAVVAALAYAVAELTRLLPSYGPQFVTLLGDATGWLRDLGIDQQQITGAISQLNLTDLVGPLQTVLGGVTNLLSDFALIIALVFFLALDAAGFTRRLTAAGRFRPDLVVALRSFASSTRRYIAVSTAFGLVVAAINVAELYWLAVPLPLLWGLVSFVTNYVPNVGFVIGLAPPALLALLEAGPGRMLAVIVVYSVTNLLIQSAIQPKIVGDSVGLVPTLTFSSLVFWSFVIGPIGALLAVPLSLLTKALLVDADPSARWVLPLLGDERSERGDDGGDG